MVLYVTYSMTFLFILGMEDYSVFIFSFKQIH